MEAAGQRDLGAAGQSDPWSSWSKCSPARGRAPTRWRSPQVSIVSLAKGRTTQVVTPWLPSKQHRLCCFRSGGRRHDLDGARPTHGQTSFDGPQPLQRVAVQRCSMPRAHHDAEGLGFRVFAPIMRPHVRPYRTRGVGHKLEIRECVRAGIP